MQKSDGGTLQIRENHIGHLPRELDAHLVQVARRSSRQRVFRE
jgi:hypothetical protein